MRLGFATDIHLDHLLDTKGYAQLKRVGRYIAQGQDALVLGGDISTGQYLKEHLAAFCEGAEVPVYFVLGNHDFWHAPGDQIRADARTFPGYLDAAGVVELNPLVALVGTSGWYDTLSGNPFESQIRVNDWTYIERLVNCWRIPQLLHQECRRWSEEETERVAPILEDAAKRYEQVYFVTHFPPFSAACFNEQGQLDTPESGWWPWSINTTLGQRILDITTGYPQVQFTVLSGHTHGKGRKQLRSNLTCISGRARYGNPNLAESWLL